MPAAFSRQQIDQCDPELRASGALELIAELVVVAVDLGRHRNIHTTSLNFSGTFATSPAITIE